MDCARDDQKFLVADGHAPVLAGVKLRGNLDLLAGHLFECAFTEVTAVGFFAVNQEHGIADFVGVCKKRLVDERRIFQSEVNEIARGICT